jgi:hypothetical protein
MAAIQFVTNDNGERGAAQFDMRNRSAAYEQSTLLRTRSDKRAQWSARDQS